MKRLSKPEVLAQMRATALIPIVRVGSAELARRAAAAVRKGGISILEVTMTVPGAVEIIAEMTTEIGDEMLIGAGTVMDPERASECIRAGAQFIVTPALNLHTIARCNEEGVVVLPGTMTPTEIVTAWDAGADMVKIFPAGEVGGPGFIKALKGPFPHIKMVPTGGVTLATAKAFLEAGSEAVGLGSDLVDGALLKQGLDDLITEKARKFVEIVRQVRPIAAEGTESGKK